MSDLELIEAVAHVTGEDAHEIRRRGFVLTGPEDSGLEPECLLDVMLVDLPETGTVDWDALGFGCREPFFTSTLKATSSQIGTVSGGLIWGQLMGLSWGLMAVGRRLWERNGSGWLDDASPPRPPTLPAQTAPHRQAQARPRLQA
jgi:hypothetical protein